MNAIEQLQTLHFRMRIGRASWKDCIDWAIARLRRDEDDDDLDVVMLAAATRAEEVDSLVPQIVERYIGPGALSAELAAGKLIVELYEQYKEGKENATSLESTFWSLFYDLGHPSWLVMLARNCEYATDTEPFQKPFDEEFQYIAQLWRASRSQEEFLSKYDGKVSGSHDAM